MCSLEITNCLQAIEIIINEMVRINKEFLVFILFRRMNIFAISIVLELLKSPFVLIGFYFLSLTFHFDFC